MIERLRFVALISLTPFLLLFCSLSLVVFNDSLYAKKVFVDKLELAQNVRNFFMDKEGLDGAFSEKEKSHLVDVKNLISNIALLGWILFFVFVFLLFYENQKFRVFYYGMLATTISFFFILLAYLIFPLSFDIFHQIFFKPGTWLFSPGSLIVDIFPFGFFSGMMLELLFRFLLLSLIGWIVLLIVKLSR